MAEHLYTGSVTADEMPQIVAACHFTREALFLAEQIPQQAISPQEGRNLLSFIAFEEQLARTCAAFSSGRIFQEDRELRWEKQGTRLRVVYLGPVDDESQFCADTLQASSALEMLIKGVHPVYYSLFGERLASSDLKKLGKVAQPGDFAVVRIPRILRYPVPQNDQKFARLAVCEYLNAETNHVDLFRFQRLEAY